MGTAPERQPPSTPEYDALAAQVIRQGLYQRGVSFDRVPAGTPKPVLTPIDRDLIASSGGLGASG